METIANYVRELVTLCGIPANAAPYAIHAAMVIVAILLSAAAGLLCRKLIVPIVQKVTARTDAKWDDIVFSKEVLLSASSIVPAIVIWVLLPMTFYEYPTVREVLARLTAIYITVMTVRTIIVIINSLHKLGTGPRTARQQYLYTISSVLKIIIIFIAAIVVIAIIIGKDPSVLLTGLGAASAILMLASLYGGRRHGRGHYADNGQGAQLRQHHRDADSPDTRRRLVQELARHAAARGT